MPGAPTPPTLLEAIASQAGGSFITNPLPENPTGTNAASIKQGFPPVTMQSELSGGKPPLGQDVNGLMFLISSHTVYVQCGQLYAYDATLATAIGGYLTGTILGMTDRTGAWLNLVNGNTSDPDAGGAGWVPMAAYGFASVVTSGGTVNLTPAQSKYGVIVITGALAGNLIVNFPTTKQQWLVINGTSGAFSTTLKTASGSGVASAQGGFAAPLGIYSVGDGNIYPTVAPFSYPIDQAPSALSIVQRTNAGYILATYFNQNSSSSENPAVGSVFVENSGGDGYLRKITLAAFESQMNLAAIAGQLVNAQVPYAVVQQWAATLFNSPTFTGSPQAPTVSSVTSNNQLATTAFANPGQVQNPNGWVKLPGGIILQWGEVFVGNIPPSPTPAIVNVTFPLAFPNTIYQVITSLSDTAHGPGAPVGPYQSAQTLSTAQFYIYEINSGVQNITMRWFAVGV